LPSNSNTASAIDLDFEEAVDVFLVFLFLNDGVTIEDFFNERTTFDCNYQENSVWNLNGILRGPEELLEAAKPELMAQEGHVLIEHFNEWISDMADDITYEGDSLFKLNTTTDNTALLSKVLENKITR
jgi:hypothetical protein